MTAPLANLTTVLTLMVLLPLLAEPDAGDGASAA